MSAFFSSDASAPVLASAPGSLIQVLDACLVTGYGSRTALGWSKVFSGTNKAVYRAATGNRFYLRVDDSDNDVARVIGYEQMSDVDTGIDPFPLNSQVAGGLYLRKTNGVTGGWAVFGNATSFYFLPETEDVSWNSSSANSAGGQFFFGQFNSFRQGDAYATMIIGSINNTLGYGNFGNFNYIPVFTGNNAALGNIYGHYVARNFLGTRRSIDVGKLPSRESYQVGSESDQLRMICGDYDVYGINYPDFITGKLTFTRILISEILRYTRPADAGITVQRGQLPGVLIPLQQGYSHGDTFNGAASGKLINKTFVIAKVYGRNVNNNLTFPGTLAFETSN